MRNHQSEEDYLKNILILQNRSGNVRSVDLANEMQFSKPSISIAMKKLEEKNMVLIDNETGYINLTEKGKQVAEMILHRHTVLTNIFIYLGVTEEVADQDACKIEHDLTDETFEVIEKYYNSFTKRK